ncbi:DUF1569 domain-containing protein [Cloacibacterium normanense]|uniref:DUF1569 domain-containing protein n=1 Tax=Cloacibacterium normanense TaxID=237258 RepID=A0A1E5UHQ0_9FLAO|nr:DUF1569 domain-containing protein [Cloacibacterium normanense]AZI69544.1 DUF1569 domain-containing protein [Cloacibacterium normanense]OEL12413.1 hypothetical protein BHF72_1167 [Cloacibacterium normanense]SDO18181.1 Protein of unknown function [Cloacibacterium normanense]
MQNVFDAKDAQEYINRINNLTPETQRKWGKMSVDQVLAHLNVAYDLTFTPEKFPKPNFIAKFLLSRFVKSKITNEIPYKQSLPTSPVFIIADERNFEEEKAKLIGNIQRVQQLGREAFEGKENINFGKMTAQCWNNMFAKHLNHHLEQFGV